MKTYCYGRYFQKVEYFLLRFCVIRILISKNLEPEPNHFNSDTRHSMQVESSKQLCTGSPVPFLLGAATAVSDS